MVKAVVGVPEFPAEFEELWERDFSGSWPPFCKAPAYLAWLSARTKLDAEMARQGEIRARIALVGELNTYLAAHRGFLGFISWDNINAFAKRWIKENQELLSRTKQR